MGGGGHDDVIHRGGTKRGRDRRGRTSGKYCSVRKYLEQHLRVSYLKVPFGMGGDSATRLRGRAKSAQALSLSLRQTAPRGQVEKHAPQRNSTTHARPRPSQPFFGTCGRHLSYECYTPFRSVPFLSSIISQVPQFSPPPPPPPISPKMDTSLVVLAAVPTPSSSPHRLTSGGGCLGGGTAAAGAAAACLRLRSPPAVAVAAAESAASAAFVAEAAYILRVSGGPAAAGTGTGTAAAAAAAKQRRRRRKKKSVRFTASPPGICPLPSPQERVGKEVGGEALSSSAAPPSSSSSPSPSPSPSPSSPSPPSSGEEEAGGLWYTLGEMDRMKTEAVREMREAMRTGPPGDLHLECRSSVQRQRCRLVARRAVLECQRRLRGGELGWEEERGDPPPPRRTSPLLTRRRRRTRLAPDQHLALISARCSLWSRELAGCLGRREFCGAYPHLAAAASSSASASASSERQQVVVMEEEALPVLRVGCPISRAIRGIKRKAPSAAA